MRVQDLFEEFSNLSSIADDVELQGKQTEGSKMKTHKPSKATDLLEKQIYTYLQGLSEVTDEE